MSFYNLIEKFYRSSYLFIARDSHMEWTQDHDLVLCRELLVINPFQAKYKTTARAKLWDQAAENLAKTTRPAFKKSLDKRAVQERYRLLTEKFKKRMAKERIESGINPTMSELDVLVEELVEREQTEKHQRENDGKLQGSIDFCFVNNHRYSPTSVCYYIVLRKPCKDRSCDGHGVLTILYIINKIKKNKKTLLFWNFFTR
mgnify:FL=1